MRRGEISQAFIIGLVIGIVLLFVALPLLGDTTERAREDLDSFRSCDAGMIAALAGPDAETGCFPRDPAGTPAAGPGWQLIGKGWGCPEEKNYCYIKVPKTGDTYTIPEIAKALCSTQPPGTVTFVKGEDSARSCFPATAGLAAVFPDENIHVGYFKREEDRESCTMDFKFIAGTGKEFSFSFPCSTMGPNTYEQNLGSTYELADGKGVDRSEFNKGGKIQITVSGADNSKTPMQEFTIKAPERGVCSSRQATHPVCQGQTMGMRYDIQRYCLANANGMDCSLKDVTTVVCSKVVDEKGGTPTDPACQGKKFSESNSCFVNFGDIGWTEGFDDWHKKAYLCELVTVDTCRQTLLAEETSEDPLLAKSEYQKVYERYKDQKCVT